MTIESLTVIVFVLTAVLALLVLVVLALARQIGVLHTRLAPAGALMNTSGPEVGAAAPMLALKDIHDKAVSIGGTAVTPTLILFVSPNCPICKELVPVARSMARAEKLKLIFASDGSAIEQHLAYAEQMDISGYPYVVSSELGLRFAADKLPYAALIDRRGILRSRGLVNSREHLESLVESMLTGYDSIQDYLVKEQGTGAGLMNTPKEILEQLLNDIDAATTGAVRFFAGHSSRRSFLGKMGAVITGMGAFPLLPMARDNPDKSAGGTDSSETLREMGDPQSCDYWRYCAFSGQICSCCGGSMTQCPPGAETATVAWVGTCHNPLDGQDYLISYNDCCGKSACGRCGCHRSEGDRPVYFPSKSNSILWCFGSNSHAYHCTLARVVGKAEVDSAS